MAMIAGYAPYCTVRSSIVCYTLALHAHQTAYQPHLHAHPSRTLNGALLCVLLVLLLLSHVSVVRFHGTKGELNDDYVQRKQKKKKKKKKKERKKEKMELKKEIDPTPSHRTALHCTAPHHPTRRNVFSTSSSSSFFFLGDGRRKEGKIIPQLVPTVVVVGSDQIRSDRLGSFIVTVTVWHTA